MENKSLTFKNSLEFVDLFFLLIYFVSAAFLLLKLTFGGFDNVMLFLFIFLILLCIADITGKLSLKVTINNNLLTYSFRRFLIFKDNITINLNIIDRAILYNRGSFLKSQFYDLTIPIFGQAYGSAWWYSSPYLLLLKKGLPLKDGVIVYMKKSILQKIKENISLNYPEILWQELNSKTIAEQAVKELIN